MTKLQNSSAPPCERCESWSRTLQQNEASSLQAARAAGQQGRAASWPRHGKLILKYTWATLNQTGALVLEQLEHLSITEMG